jgi:type IV secretory pathway TrbD component
MLQARKRSRQQVKGGPAKVLLLLGVVMVAIVYLLQLAALLAAGLLLLLSEIVLLVWVSKQSPQQSASPQHQTGQLGLPPPQQYVFSSVVPGVKQTNKHLRCGSRTGLKAAGSSRAGD